MAFEGRLVPPGLTFRSPTADDAHQVRDLMCRCEVSEYGEPDPDMEDLLHDWDQIELHRDAWLAFDARGDLVGYGAVLPWWTNLRYDLYVEPAWPGEELGQALLARCEERGLALVRARQEAANVLAKTYPAHTDHRGLALVEQAGFRLVKHHFQMQVRLDPAPPQPRWPAGIVVRTAVPGQDDQPLYDLIQAAFDQPGRQAPAFADWKSAMLRTDIFDETLWFLALAGKEIAGACLCFEYPGLGWVRELGVHNAWRGQGLGTALLLHAFGQFRQRGFERVGLFVESARPGAQALYTRVDLRTVRQYDEYEKPVGPGEVEDVL
jgi:mycothiol synthase